MVDPLIDFTPDLTYYRKVRYLYKILRSNQTMQKMITVYMSRRQTTAQEMACYICGRGLAQGNSVTARAIRDDTVLFCDVHHKI